MKFGFTRDSLLMYALAAGAALGYLATAPTPPTEWGYRDWLNALTVAIAWIVGKLQTSPLPHSTLGDAKITREDVA